MKKAVHIISLLALVLAFLAACGGKSRNAELGREAMDEGNYERALRLYTFAIEKDEADSEDKEIYEVIRSYIDANNALKSEDFAGGLQILDDCKIDYSSLAIRADIELLRNHLSDGKYADERINTLESIIDAGNLDMARDMITDISQLSLTTNQRSRLEEISRKVSDMLSGKDSDNYFIYYIDGSSDSSVPMYAEANAESDILTRISGGTPVEARDLAGNGFIMIVYNGETGYVKVSDITPNEPDGGSDGGKDKDNNKDDQDKDKDKDQDKDDGDEKPKATVPVEAISADDTLFAIVDINFRDEPNTDCEVIGTIPAGSEVTYLGEMEHGFYKVEYNGAVGYAYSDYLQRSN